MEVSNQATSIIAGTSGSANQNSVLGKPSLNISVQFVQIWSDHENQENMIIKRTDHENQEYHMIPPWQPRPCHPMNTFLRQSWWYWRPRLQVLRHCINWAINRWQLRVFIWKSQLCLRPCLHRSFQILTPNEDSHMTMLAHKSAGNNLWHETPEARLQIMNELTRYTRESTNKKSGADRQFIQMNPRWSSLQSWLSVQYTVDFFTCSLS